MYLATYIAAVNLWLSGTMDPKPETKIRISNASFTGIWPYNAISRLIKILSLKEMIHAN